MAKTYGRFDSVRTQLTRGELKNAEQATISPLLRVDEDIGYMRRGEVDLARQSLENLASGFDADISRNVELPNLLVVRVNYIVISITYEFAVLF